MTINLQELETGGFLADQTLGSNNHRSHSGQPSQRWRWSQDYLYRRNTDVCGPVDERSREGVKLGLASPSIMAFQKVAVLERCTSCRQRMLC